MKGGEAKLSVCSRLIAASRSSLAAKRGMEHTHGERHQIQDQ
nr:MAG TPA: hypothetical protein [Caudoviricetes sp.]